MGIESDQLVFDYLSRVGDLAQQRQLPSVARMRLVSELRNEIDRRRAKSPVDSPAAVRRILDRLGTPDEVVAAASGSPADAGSESRPAAVPVQRASDFEERPKGLRRVVPRPRPAEPRPEDSSGNAASPPTWPARTNSVTAPPGPTGGGWRAGPAPGSDSATACPGSSAAWRSPSC
ncbi:hypothetical protein MBT84_23840 [Streptomyces sp. MBT84]|nr:hypothetical protein [Streptomyces sp. MBT84]